MQDRGSNVVGLASLQPNLSSAPAPTLLDPGCEHRKCVYLSSPKSNPTTGPHNCWLPYRQLVFIRIEDFVQVAVGHSQVVLMDEAGRGGRFTARWTLTVCTAKQKAERAPNKTLNCRTLSDVKNKKGCFYAPVFLSYWFRYLGIKRLLKLFIYFTYFLQQYCNLSIMGLSSWNKIVSVA